ncbi:MAG: hypothetical protein KatS3mg008_1363 [Acidimicrobiales bacterium]|nr:MAG: hypothetical protein KatS3mg008_1363 [Acidimicrobiales bacterium]
MAELRRHEVDVRATSQVRVLIGLLWRSASTPGRAVAALLASSVSIAAGLAARAAGNHDATLVLADDLLLTLAVPLTALSVSAALFGNMREDGSIVYLWMRPVPGVVVAFSAWVASLAFVLPTALLATAAPLAIARAPSELFVSTIWAAGLASAAYSALFLVPGLRLRRPVVASLVYWFAWEVLAGAVGGFVLRVSVIGYVRAVIAPAAENVSPAVSVAAAPVSPMTAAAACMTFTGVALLLAGIMFDRQEIR